MDRVRSIRNRRSSNGATFDGAWAIRVPGYHKAVRDYLIFASDLRGRPGRRKETLYMKGATHKCAIHAVHPETPVDFKKNLFDQSQLGPFKDPFIEYQTKYESDDDCFSRIESFVLLITNLDLPPFAGSPQEFDRWVNRVRKNRAPYVIVPRPYVILSNEYEDAA